MPIIFHGVIKKIMASALSVEGFFSALTGGNNNEPEIDFPFDRLFRKIGVYLRCLMGAILIGAAIQNPATCFSPGNEQGKNEFVNSYCISQVKHPVSYNETTEEPLEEKIYLFHWLPYVLFTEAFLAFLPYLIYSGNTKAIISPILNEAQDMVVFTSGLFEGKIQMIDFCNNLQSLTCIPFFAAVVAIAVVVVVAIVVVFIDVVDVFNVVAWTVV